MIYLVIHINLRLVDYPTKEYCMFKCLVLKVIVPSLSQKNGSTRPSKTPAPNMARGRSNRVRNCQPHHPLLSRLIPCCLQNTTSTCLQTDECNTIPSNDVCRTGEWLRQKGIKEASCYSPWPWQRLLSLKTKRSHAGQEPHRSPPWKYWVHLWWKREGRLHWVDRKEYTKKYQSTYSSIWHASQSTHQK